MFRGVSADVQLVYCTEMLSLARDRVYEVECAWVFKSRMYLPVGKMSCPAAPSGKRGPFFHTWVGCCRTVKWVRRHHIGWGREPRSSPQIVRLLGDAMKSKTEPLSSNCTQPPKPIQAPNPANAIIPFLFSFPVIFLSGFQDWDQLLATLQSLRCSREGPIVSEGHLFPLFSF